jgi:hypothetical protein
VFSVIIFHIVDLKQYKDKFSPVQSRYCVKEILGIPSIIIASIARRRRRNDYANCENQVKIAFIVKILYLYLDSVMVNRLLIIKIVGIQRLLILFLSVELLLGFHPTLHSCAAHLRVPNSLLRWRIEEVIITHLLLLIALKLL